VTLLTFNSKYVIASTTAVTTTSATLVDDTEASQTFTLDASKVVLVIYQTNNVHGATMIAAGMQNAIKIDESDFANSWDSAYISAYCVRNTMVFVGTLAAGSHTIKGRFASNSAGQTVTISNRVLLIIIFDGDEFQYVDDATTATAPDGTLIDDPNAQVTFTPSATCKALILYNISNNGATESTYGKKAAIRVATTDYAQAEKSPGGSNYVDSVFTCHALSLSAVSTTVKGRFANSRTITATVTIHRRQLAVLLLADSTLLDVITSTTQVSTTSDVLVDDTQATISRTTSDTRELLVVAMGTKRYNVSSALTGECYGIKVDVNERVNSRGSPGGTAYANSAGTAYAEQLAADVHTVQGRFSNNNGANTAKISARQVVALWFSVGGAILKEVTDSLSLSDAVLRDKTLAISDSVASLDSLLANKTLQITDTITVLETILRDKTFTVSDSIGLSELITVITGGILKEVLDAIGLSEQVKVDKSLIIQDVISILDQIFRHKPEVTITDVIALAEVIAVSKLFTITDAVSIADVVYAMKTLPIYDQITITDQVSTPTRILQALDAIGLSDTLYVNKTLIITDQIALAEVVEVGKGGAAKTKLFLILGDLAIQIQG
jgi:hypothetical protein